MKIVSLLTPIPCGVYQHHFNLLHGLVPHGYDIRWICSGSAQARLIAAGGAEWSDGEVVASSSDSLADRSKILIERISEISPDIVLCHAVGDRVDFNVVRYLPESIPKVLILHHSTLATYRGARAIRDHVHATVAISPRIEQDLIFSYGFRQEKTHLISHGIDTGAYSQRLSKPNDTGNIRMLFHGRIVRDKGVFWIPDILSALARQRDDWELTVSGDGPDLPELRRQIEHRGLSNRVRFSGWTSSENVPALMNLHDILLFPSQIEGFGLTLIEAMAGGCVPVASRLPGITDWIIEDGVDGLLFSIGNVPQAVQHLNKLLSNRHLLAALCQMAQKTTTRFSMNTMAERYHELFLEVHSHPGKVRTPENANRFKLARGLRPAWWYRLPAPAKEYFRSLREKARAVALIP